LKFRYTCHKQEGFVPRGDRVEAGGERTLQLQDEAGTSGDAGAAGGAPKGRSTSRPQAGMFAPTRPAGGRAATGTMTTTTTGRETGS